MVGHTFYSPGDVLQVAPRPDGAGRVVHGRRAAAPPRGARPARRLRVRHRGRHLPDDAAQPARLPRHHRHQRRARVPPPSSASSSCRSTRPRSRSSRSAGALAHRGCHLPAVASRRLRGRPPDPHRHRRRRDAQQRHHVRPVEGRGVGPPDGDAVAHREASTAPRGTPSCPSPIACAVLVPLLLGAGAGPRHAPPGRRHRSEPRRARPSHAHPADPRGRRRCSRFATAAHRPIAFVAFMAGPIAARLVGPGGSLAHPRGSRRRAPRARRRPHRPVRLRHTATPSASSPACSARPI